MVDAEAADELGVGDEPYPTLADCGGAGKRGRLRGEAEEDHPEEIVIFKRGGRRRRRPAVAAGHPLSLVLVGFGDRDSVSVASRVGGVTGS